MVLVRRCLPLFVLFFCASNLWALDRPIFFDFPQGGELFVPGTTTTIRQKRRFFKRMVRIELSRDGGLTWELVGDIDNTVRPTKNRYKLNWVVTGPETSDAVLRATSLDPKRPGQGLSASFSIGQTAGSLPSGLDHGNLAGLADDDHPQYLRTDGTRTLTGNQSAGGNKITNVAAPTANADAANKQYVDNANATQDTAIAGKVSKTGDTMTGGLSISGSLAGNIFSVTTTGSGRPGTFTVSNAAGVQSALRAVTNGIGPALSVSSSGTGRSANFENTNAANANPTVRMVTNGVGPALSISSSGTSNAGFFELTNPSSGASTVHAQNNGNGRAITGITTGTGNAGFFQVLNPSSPAAAVQGSSNGAGPAFGGGTSGVGPAMRLQINNPANTKNTISAETFGVGGAGFFSIINTSSSASALFSTTIGTGAAFRADHRGPSGNIAVFQNNTANVARIDKAGRGFFNGGVQTGGADVAEMFQVIGESKDYEPGDVLVLSTSKVRHVEKSKRPYSRLISGIYATKPGVLLSERNISEPLDGMIPMGVIGVIPTKVSGENGPIRIGDLLVTASLPGHAMKGTEPKRMLGALIGKAMENFSGKGTGVIKVLVNVK